MTPTWLACLALAALAVAPVLLTLRRTGAGLHWRPAALALYRAQLTELDRELADRRIAAVDHAAAVLEVQRRLLAAGGLAEPASAPPSPREPLVLAVVIVLAAAFGLYTIGGRPGPPATAVVPPTTEASAAPTEAPNVAQSPGDGLRQALTGSATDPSSDPDGVRQTLIEQGDAAERTGDLSAASAAWHRALVLRFDPLLAVRTADAESKVEGRIGFDAATLFRRALATVPADTPWRSIVERRLADAEPPG